MDTIPPSHHPTIPRELYGKSWLVSPGDIRNFYDMFHQLSLPKGLTQKLEVLQQTYCYQIIVVRHVDTGLSLTYERRASML